MRNHRLIGSLLALLLVTLVLPACSSVPGVDPPEVLVTNITPLDSTMLEQRVNVDLRILNPNDGELSVNGMDFRLDVNGIKLARGLSNQAFLVPRLGEAVTTVTVSTTLFDIVRQVAAAQSARVLDYELSGRVHLDRAFFGKVPFSTSGQLSLEQFGLTGAGAP